MILLQCLGLQYPGGERRRFVGLMAALLVILAAPVAMAGTGIADFVANNCAACHGADGNSSVAQYPKLSAQISQYIVKQLEDFKAGRRENAIMSSMAAGLNADRISALAQFFSEQKNAPDTPGDSALSAEGAKIYQGGLAASHTPACAACHGPEGLGLPPSYPRLSGQHADYVEAQLHQFRKGDRHNDDHGVMRSIAAGLTDHQMAEIAAYLDSRP
jgi:cytochrome c553